MSTAVDYLPDLIIRDEVSRGVLKDTFESQTDLEILYVRLRSSKLEQLLGNGDDKRLTERSTYLTSEKVEKLGGSCALAESEVHAFSNFSMRILTRVISWGVISGITQLKESLDAA